MFYLYNLFNLIFFLCKQIFRAENREIIWYNLLVKCSLKSAEHLHQCKFYSIFHFIFKFFFFLIVIRCASKNKIILIILGVLVFLCLSIAIAVPFIVTLYKFSSDNSTNSETSTISSKWYIIWNYANHFYIICVFQMLEDLIIVVPASLQLLHLQ